MINSPFFSIITVSFNSESTIENTLKSLLSQTFTDFEYILIDGNSKDGTLNIIKEYEEKFKMKDISFKWISEKDYGIYDAMNKGIKMSSGEIIGIINSDDYYENNALDIISRSVIEYPGNNVYHGLLKYYDSGELISIKGDSSNILYKNMIQHPSTFVSRMSYIKFGLFDTKYKYVADYEFLLRLKFEKASFIFVPEILANFFDGGAGDNVKSVIESLKLKKEKKIISKKVYFFKVIKEYVHRKFIRRSLRF